MADFGDYALCLSCGNKVSTAFQVGTLIALYETNLLSQCRILCASGQGCVVASTLLRAWEKHSSGNFTYESWADLTTPSDSMCQDVKNEDEELLCGETPFDRYVFTPLSKFLLSNQERDCALKSVWDPHNALGSVLSDYDLVPHTFPTSDCKFPMPIFALSTLQEHKDGCYELSACTTKQDLPSITHGWHIPNFFNLDPTENIANRVAQFMSPWHTQQNAEQSDPLALYTVEPLMQLSRTRNAKNGARMIVVDSYSNSAMFDKASPSLKISTGDKISRINQWTLDSSSKTEYTVVQGGFIQCFDMSRLSSIDKKNEWKRFMIKLHTHVQLDELPEDLFREAVCWGYASVYLQQQKQVSNFPLKSNMIADLLKTDA